MIAFRHTDPRFPFLREGDRQPASRWNRAGQLTHSFCETPDGARAEFVLFGRRPNLVGWAATVAGRPGEALLPAVRPL